MKKIMIFLFFMMLLFSCTQKAVEKEAIKEKVKQEEAAPKIGSKVKTIDAEKFKLDYSENWQQKEVEGLIVLLPTGKEEELTVIMRYEDVDENVKLDDLKNFFESTNGELSGIKKLETKDIDINGKKGYQTVVEYSFKDEQENEVDQIIDSRYLVHNSGLYMIEFGGMKKSYDEKKAEIEAMFSSFAIK